MKKKHIVESWPKVYRVPADLRPLQNYATVIINSSRAYYRNRATHLIGTGRRCMTQKKRLKG